MTLSEFILARVAEWEKWATEAKGDGDGVWASWNRSWDTEPQRDLAADGVRIAALPTTVDEHVAGHSPARVLRQCEAIRTIVAERHEALDQAQQGDMSGKIAEFAFSLTLSHLAGIWSDHPDFRAWAK